MTPKKKRRLMFVAALVAAGGALAMGVIYQLGQNTMYFRSPTDVVQGQVPEGVAFRLGGLVADGSVRHGDGADVHFAVSDGNSKVAVDFRGVLPALFREGQGVVALGSIKPDGKFAATEVLAKHDEKYMPPEVVESLKRSGRWKEGS